jgi:hypothetical protein
VVSVITAVRKAPPADTEALREEDAEDSKNIKQNVFNLVATLT